MLAVTRSITYRLEYQKSIEELHLRFHSEMRIQVTIAESQPIVLVTSRGRHTLHSYTKLNETISSFGFEVYVPALMSISDERITKWGSRE